MEFKFPPMKGSVHEVYGAGSTFFAFMLAAKMGGPVFWVRDRWNFEPINPVGFADFISPDLVTLINAEGNKPNLAVAEEALRENAVSTVVLELDQPLSLIEGRRLQLAAKSGKTTGICLIREATGSNAARTRWHCQPIFNPQDSTLQRWELKKNKSGTLGTWHVRWDRSSHCLIMVSPVSN